ncbi:MAG TPA: hypothetical protein EYN73_09190 [Chromatiaceae bacterium]|nr:hypothetical protein [Chromatiaceae bacterium]HIA09218.1 hypothetical protein [Chromatiaceae bacterium]HIN82108.1 hypothetical protein [Chromatiales bacterium]
MAKHGYTKYIALLFCSCLLTCGGCMITNEDEKSPSPVQQDSPDPNKEILVTEDTFVCLEKMHPVRGFFVGNLLDKLDDTVAAAMQPEGAPYPPGSIVQLIPTEVMIKHFKGWSTKTNDWEFFELDVSDEGSKIKVRGTTRVKNKFGGSCVACHQKAKPQWDFICEEGHGCDPLPIPDFLIRSVQRNDPRCN